MNGNIFPLHSVNLQVTLVISSSAGRLGAINAKTQVKPEAPPPENFISKENCYRAVPGGLCFDREPVY